jgi:hypothetical protein
VSFVDIGPCQRRIATVWLLGSGLIYLLVLVQTLFGYYGDDAETAWSWILPITLPTLSLIIGVMVAGARKRQKGRNDQVSEFVYRLALGLSLFYLSVVLLTLLVQPIVEVEPPDLMKQSNLWLAPLQGLVTASLGAFYISKEQGTG